MKKSNAIILTVFGTVLCLGGLISLITIGRSDSFEILSQKAVQDLIAVSLGALVSLFGFGQTLEAMNR